MTRAEVEAEVRRLCEAGSLHAAATVAIQGLGPELLGFLVAVTADRSEAGEIFADVCVRLWKSLATFRWESSLRTWAYVLARRACHAYRQERAAWGSRHVRLSQVPEIDAVIVRMRTTTLANLGGEKTRVQRLRDRLAPDEQILLTLRVDRELEWRDIACVLADDEQPDPAELARSAAGLRKRFERLKEKLRRLAAEEP